MQSLRNYLPSLRKDRSAPVSDVVPPSPDMEKTDALDPEKSSSDDVVLDADELETDPATADDPSLNPGGLTYAEGM